MITGRTANEGRGWGRGHRYSLGPLIIKKALDRQELNTGAVGLEGHQSSQNKFYRELKEKEK